MRNYATVKIPCYTNMAAMLTRDKKRSVSWTDFLKESCIIQRLIHTLWIAIVIKLHAHGSVTAQAISCWLLIKGPSFKPRAVHVGYVVTKWHSNRFFSEYFIFPLSIIILPVLHIHAFIIRGWYSWTITNHSAKWLTQSQTTPYTKW